MADPDIRECWSLVFAEFRCMNDQPCALLASLFSCSPLMSWRRDSTRASLHIVFKSSASMSLISLCRCTTNPPRFQIMASSNVKTCPHTEGNIIEWPVIYCSLTALRNSYLIRLEIISRIGSIVSLFKLPCQTFVCSLSYVLILILSTLSLTSPGLNEVRCKFTSWRVLPARIWKAKALRGDLENWTLQPAFKSGDHILWIKCIVNRTLRQGDYTIKKNYE